MLIARSILTALATLGMMLPVDAAPAMWEVRDDDSKITIFGSFLIPHSSTTWRTEAFDGVLEASETIVIEADYRPEAMLPFTTEAYGRGIYTDGTLLTDVIDDETEVLLRRLSRATGVAVGSLLAMRPWLAGVVLSTASLTASGLDAWGIELQLSAELTEDRLRFFETADEQLDLLSEAPADQQVALLQAQLVDVDTTAKFLEKARKSWMGGEVDTLADWAEQDAARYDAAITDRYLLRRAIDRTTQLKDLLAEDVQALVVLNAAYVIGESGVLELLRAGGYEIERIQ
jgi:uncharacterized protein